VPARFRLVKRLDYQELAIRTPLVLVATVPEPDKTLHLGGKTELFSLKSVPFQHRSVQFPSKSVQFWNKTVQFH
jgi:hypothetical protein